MLSHWVHPFGPLIPEMKWFLNSRLCPTVLEAGRSEVKALADSVSGASPLPGS